MKRRVLNAPCKSSSPLWKIRRAVHKVLHRGGSSKKDHIAEGKDLTQRRHNG